MQRTLAFYKSLGFKPSFAFGDKSFTNQFGTAVQTVKESYRGVVFNIGSTLFEIADGHIAVKSGVFKETITSSKVSLMLYVPSVKQIVALCSRNSYQVAVPVRTFPWGTKELVVKDPDGFILVFIEKVD